MFLDKSLKIMSNQNNCCHSTIDSINKNRNPKDTSNNNTKTPNEQQKEGETTHTNALGVFNRLKQIIAESTKEGQQDNIIQHKDDISQN